MGVRVANKKPNWRRGKEMPEFSGKTWAELQDIYPVDMRIKDDAWKMMGLITPAYLVTQYQFKELLGGTTIGIRDFMMMCFMQRVEEAQGNVGFRAWPLLKGMNVSGQIFYNRKAKMTRLGLIENMPVNHVRLYRVSALGKSMIKCFCDNLNKANEDILAWVANHDDESKIKLTRMLDSYMPGWNQGL